MKQASENAATSVIHELQHAQKKYRVITSSEEILHRSGEQLVRACQLHISAEVWVDNFKRMESYVMEWCGKRPTAIAAMLVEVRTNKVVFWIVPLSEEYNFDLGFELAELDIYLSSQGGIGYCETRQVPYWDLMSFVPADSQMRWVNPTIPSHSGEPK